MFAQPKPNKNEKGRIPDQVFTLSYGDIVGEHDHLLEKKNKSDGFTHGNMYILEGFNMPEFDAFERRKGPFIIANVYTEDGKYYVVKGGSSKVREFLKKATDVPFAGQVMFVKRIMFHNNATKSCFCDVMFNNSNSKNEMYTIEKLWYARALKEKMGRFASYSIVRNAQFKKLVRFADRSVNVMYRIVRNAQEAKIEILGVYRTLPDCFPRELKGIKQ